MIKPKKLDKLKSVYPSTIKALIESDFNRERAAQMLNITRRTLYNRLKKFKEVGLHQTNST